MSAETTGDVRARVSNGWQSVRRARRSAALPRYLASAALLVFCCLGLRAAFFSAAPTPATTHTPSAADAPSEDFALQFARAYLTYDSAHPGDRIRALAPFLGGGQLESDAGLAPGSGSQSVLWAEVASDQRALSGGRTITVAAEVSSQRRPLYLALTVEHATGQPLRLLGYPALVGAPAIGPPPGSELEAVTDPELRQVVERVLRNYLSGAATNLRADLSADAQVTLPTRRLSLQGLESLDWLGGQGSGAVLATLSATDAVGTTYHLTYELGIAYRERPYVDFIEVVPTSS